MRLTVAIVFLFVGVTLITASKDTNDVMVGVVMAFVSLVAMVYLARPARD
jgi:drug/metabolite transporter (DMT)-like permease